VRPKLPFIVGNQRHLVWAAIWTTCPCSLSQLIRRRRNPVAMERHSSAVRRDQPGHDLVRRDLRSPSTLIYWEPGIHAVLDGSARPGDNLYPAQVAEPRYGKTGVGPSAFAMILKTGRVENTSLLIDGRSRSTAQMLLQASRNGIFSILDAPMQEPADVPFGL